MAFFDSLKNAFSPKKEEPPKPKNTDENNSLIAFITGAPGYQNTFLQGLEEDDNSNAGKTALFALSLIISVSKGNKEPEFANEADMNEAANTFQSYFSLSPVYHETVNHILANYKPSSLAYRAAVLHTLQYERQRMTILQNMLVTFILIYQKHTKKEISAENFEKAQKFFFLPQMNARASFIELISEVGILDLFTEKNELYELGMTFAQGNEITTSDYEKYYITQTPDPKSVTEEFHIATLFMEILLSKFEFFGPGIHNGVQAYREITQNIQNPNSIQEFFDKIGVDYTKPGNFQMVINCSKKYKEQFL